MLRNAIWVRGHRDEMSKLWSTESTKQEILRHVRKRYAEPSGSRTCTPKNEVPKLWGGQPPGQEVLW